MRVFCDTNVLIAAFLSSHPHHNPSRKIIERVKRGKDKGFVSAHTLAEVYAVLTRLPEGNQVAPMIAWQLISENLLKNFSIVALSATEYADAISNAACNGIEGGKTYDALILAAALKVRAEQVYTLNVRHFQSLAPGDFRSCIVAPQ